MLVLLINKYKKLEIEFMILKKLLNKWNKNI
jgi:hypothetical protein